MGDTKVYVGSVGHTWTLSPTLVLDGNFGYYRQDQVVTGPDYGTNLGLDLGIPGVNDPNDIRASGLPPFANGYTIGTTPRTGCRSIARKSTIVQQRVDEDLREARNASGR